MVESLSTMGFRAIQIQCADRLAASSFARDYQVQSQGVRITYGTKPFELAE
jgi:hypothetical protein